MMSRKKIIEDLLQTTYAMRHKVMIGYTTKKVVVITPSQGFVLRFVAENKTANVKAISRALHITSSAATQLIEGLVNKGYLIREASLDDRRVVSLSLSEKAKKLFKEFREQGLQRMTEIFCPLTDAELAQYATLNKKIAENITRKNNNKGNK